MGHILTSLLISQHQIEYKATDLVHLPKQAFSRLQHQSIMRTIPSKTFARGIVEGAGRTPMLPRVRHIVVNCEAVRLTSQSFFPGACSCRREGRV